MRTPSRSPTTRIRFATLAATLVLSTLSPLPASDVPIDARSLALKIAHRYGLDAFPGVASLRYTFNVTYKGKTTVRTWTWFPVFDSVEFSGKDPGGLHVTMNWSRKNPYSMGSEAVTAIDRMFVNDQYWLLFPFHLAWDKIDLAVAAIPAESRTPGEDFKLTATYPSQGGYTPGDAYDLFVDTGGTVKRWIFRKGNAPAPTRDALWADPVAVGPLRLSLERPGTDGDFKVWFTDVSAQTQVR